MNIHLVDGQFELFRAFYGRSPKARNAAGREVGAVRQLLRTMLMLLNDEGGTHVAVAFDHVIESFRNDLFAGYKTGDGVDPDLKQQFHLAEDAIEALGLVTWRMVEFEADDAIAAGAAKYAADPRVEQILLCSPDKDMAQCVVGNRIVMRDRMRKRTFDEAAVLEKWGLPPASIPDWLALVGDNADGLPGIPRWGAKSTAAVLTRYGSVENIPSDSVMWDIKVRGAPALSENLRNNRDAALLYKLLATLRLDVPLDESVDDLEWKGADRQALTKILVELDYERFLERVPKFR